ncbi:MAG: hypothetical protein GY928_38960 [Colwellia sp.]|nr:hypothetical protein [Colwellia sp.]
MSDLIECHLSSKLDDYIKACYYELKSGSSDLLKMNQRKYRASVSGDYLKWSNIGLAMELYKQDEFLRKRGI